MASQEARNRVNLNGEVHPDENREPETGNLGNSEEESAVFGEEKVLDLKWHLTSIAKFLNIVYVHIYFF